MDLERQKQLITQLGAIDGNLRTIETVVENLAKEGDMLRNQRVELLLECEHVDEEGNLVLAGGGHITWCQICGALLSEEEVIELEKEQDEKDPK